MPVRSERRVAAAALLVVATAPLSSANAADEHRVTLDDQTAIAVTIYNNNLAMVRDYRRVKLRLGTNRLAFVDVSGKMRPETAILTSSDNVSFNLLEQNFNYDLLTPRKLLEKSVGKEVTIVRTNPQTKEEERLRAKVLSTNGGAVFEIDGKIYTGHLGRVVFDRVPENLRARPTLVVTLASKATVNAPIELTYLTRGLSWRADYVALLNETENKLNLNGWVTLNNRSGTTYKNARLQLVAGDVAQVARTPRATARLRRDAMKAREARAMRRQALFDYHIYSLQRPTTIAHNQQKQVALLKASNVSVVKEYRLQGTRYYYRYRYSAHRPTKADVWLIFDNTKKANLGLPLPKGTIRAYKKDAAGKAVFIGEANIGHTAEGETVRLRVGKAFDVSGERVQTDYKKEGLARYTYETAYKITLRNAKRTPVRVIVSEPIPGDWKIVTESQKHVKVSAHRAEWKVDVPAKGKTELTYRVRVDF
jgi:hypothetical protein